MLFFPQILIHNLCNTALLFHSKEGSFQLLPAMQNSWSRYFQGYWVRRGQAV